MHPLKISTHVTEWGPAKSVTNRAPHLLTPALYTLAYDMTLQLALTAQRTNGVVLF